MIGKVLPEIKRCWPRESRGETIWIQQDNARTHVPADDPDWLLAVAQTGLDIRLMHQPPNSPDMNILDLGFFASLQSKADDLNSSSLNDLIANVLAEYQNYNPYLLNRVFLTLQGSLIEVMKQRGGNHYKIPHMNKDRLERLGILPDRLSCDCELYEEVMQALST